MLRTIGVCSFLFVTIASSVLAFSQVQPSQTDAISENKIPAAPVAYVYVSINHGGAYEVNGYSAASNGQLTAISGSPFSANVQSIAVKGKYLFGTNGVDIDSFSVSSSGALTQVSTLNAQNFNQNSCGGPENVFLDRTGVTLYDADLLGNICANNAYQSFGIDASTGALSYLGSAVASPAYNAPLSFTGGNVYGYSSSCYHFLPSLWGYQRNADQTLSQINMNAAMPTQPAGIVYCPYLAAADSSNHVAVPMMPLNANTWQPDGLLQLAVYTSGTSGNLITTSTYSNMPTTAVTSVTDLQISPSGLYLAIAGTTGLQVLHFNGANPIKKFTGLLLTHQVDHVFWDNSNHLYAISTSAGKLYVFNVTSTTVTQALGSPYTVTSPQNLAVLVK